MSEEALLGIGATLFGPILAPAAPFVGEYLAGRSEAEAAGEAERAKQAAAQEQRRFALEKAAPTTAELEQIGRQISSADVALARQEKLLAAIDPALIEAGNQALKLLRGQEASVIAPLRNQRDSQRQQLVQQLESQMGPGASSSTAGADALRKFDADTSSQIANAQQGVLGSLLGTSLNARPNPYADVSARNPILSNLSNLQSRQINASFGSDVSRYAGAPFAADILNAQNLGALSKNIGATGQRLGAAALSGGMSAPVTPGTAGITPIETNELSSNLNELQNLNR